MPIIPIAIVVPTHGVKNRLKEFIQSIKPIQSCSWIDMLSVHIIENGSQRSTNQALVDHVAPTLPIHYHHRANPGKSGALNQLVTKLHDHFIIFFDDDGKVFFAGRCEADYISPPPAWLLHYLPPSAKGWKKGKDKDAITKPEAMGFNWAARASDLIEAGLFEESIGPGMPLRVGDETRLQARLISNGVIGVYLEDAGVWHYVPPERCNTEWASERAHQNGILIGAKLRPKRISTRWALQNLYGLKYLAYRFVLPAVRSGKSPTRSFHYRYRCSQLKGRIRGMGLN